MGTVYRATHIGTGRPVALKVIAPQFMSNEEFVERFKREAKAAGLLRHPNVVNVTDFGFTNVNNDRIAYLVMEYLNGSNLGDLMKAKGKLPLSFVVDIVEQIGLALTEAHQHGIIHRDLKPDNIWLEPNGRGGYNVKVLDFGLAKLRDNLSTPRLNSSPPALPSATLLYNPEPSTNSAITIIQTDQANMTASTEIHKEAINNQNPPLTDDVATAVMNGTTTDGNIESPTMPEWMTQVGTVLGTPLYMSPEQCSGKELDTRSDIYSLGIMVYQMLAGETPFTGNMYQLIVKHNELPPVSLLEKCADLPKLAADLIMSSLAKNVGQRPQTVSAFANALRTASETEVMILRQAITLFNENFQLFLKLTFISYAPLFLGVIILAANIFIRQLPGSRPMQSLEWFIGLLSIAIILLGIPWARAANGGLFVPVVAQLSISPLRPGDLNIFWANFKSRFVTYLKTFLLAVLPLLNIIVVLILLIRISLELNSNYIIPVILAGALLSAFIIVRDAERIYFIDVAVLAEGKQGSAALARSKELTDFFINHNKNFYAILNSILALTPLLTIAFTFCWQSCLLRGCN